MDQGQKLIHQELIYSTTHNNMRINMRRTRGTTMNQKKPQMNNITAKNKKIPTREKQWMTRRKK